MGSDDPRARSVVVIGTFDGVHLGHRRLIDEARSCAEGLGLRCLVVTFDRHPAAIVRPATVPPLLTDVTQKIELLEATGVDEVVVLAFDEARAAESAEDFVREVIVERLAARQVYVGASFRFGHRAAGDVQMLTELGAELGFGATAVPLLTDEPSHTVVSSTSIRALVAAGDLVAAARLLGRPHAVRGTMLVPACSPVAELEVPAGLLLPPPGRYRVLAGPLHGRGVDGLARVEAGSRRVGIESAPGAGTVSGRPPVAPAGVPPAGVPPAGVPPAGVPPAGAPAWAAAGIAAQVSFLNRSA